MTLRASLSALRIAPVMFALAVPLPANAADILGSCGAEIEQHCSDVVPGHGRLAACLYAHEDKLDAECDGAIGDYGDLMDAVFERIRFATQECRTELAQLCMDEAGVADGPLTCLAAKSSELSDGCRSAVERFDALED